MRQHSHTCHGHDNTSPPCSASNREKMDYTKGRAGAKHSTAQHTTQQHSTQVGEGEGPTPRSCSLTSRGLQVVLRQHREASSYKNKEQPTQCYKTKKIPCNMNTHNQHMLETTRREPSHTTNITSKGSKQWESELLYPIMACM